MEPSCPKCSSPRWMTNLPLLPLSDVTVCVTPATFTKAPTGVSPVRAEMCADCGFTEFYGQDPHKVWKAWQRRGE